MDIKENFKKRFLHSQSEQGRRKFSSYSNRGQALIESIAMALMFAAAMFYFQLIAQKLESERSKNQFTKNRGINSGADKIQR